MKAAAEVRAFKGLNTTDDPIRLGLGWLTQADNCDIVDSSLRRCHGFAQSLEADATLRGVYATQDEQRLFVVDGLSLSILNLDFTTTELATLTGTGAMYFAEGNGQVFCTNGTDFLIIEADNSVKTWGIPEPEQPEVTVTTGPLSAGQYQVCCTLVHEDGREGGNCPPVVVDLADNSGLTIVPVQVDGYTTNVYVTNCDGTVFFLLAENASVANYNVGPDSLGLEFEFYNANAPHGIMPAIFKGQMYLAEYYPSVDQSVIWWSADTLYHLFDDSAGGIQVPGQVLMVGACEAGIVIGSDRKHFGWDGTTLTELADYGVVSGHHAARLGPLLYWWSRRGLCRGLPFVNLTENTVSVAPGSNAGGIVMQRDGSLRYVVALERGGTAYNSR